MIELYSVAWLVRYHEHTVRKYYVNVHGMYRDGSYKCEVIKGHDRGRIVRAYCGEHSYITTSHRKAMRVYRLYRAYHLGYEAPKKKVKKESEEWI